MLIAALESPIGTDSTIWKGIANQRIMARPNRAPFVSRLLLLFLQALDEPFVSRLPLFLLQSLNEFVGFRDGAVHILDELIDLRIHLDQFTLQR